MSAFLDLITERLQRDKNLILIVTGETGSGKSYVGLRLGEMVNPGHFGVHRIVFSAEAFMELLNSGTLKKGDVIVFDEAGVGIPAKEWYEISNRLFNYVLQTFRQDNLVLIFTTPSLGFIDGDSRKLVHYIIETKRIDYLTNQNICKIYEVQHNPRLNKNYYKLLRIKGVKINPVRVNKPTEGLIAPYLLKKRGFTNELNQNAEALIKKNKSKKYDKKMDPKKLYSELKNKLDFYSHETHTGERKIDLHLILAHYKSKGVSRDTAIAVKKQLEREING